MLIERHRHRFLDDIANFLISTISLTLTHELYISGTAGRYQSNHIIQIDGKQVGQRLKIYPSNLLDQFFLNLVWPEQIRFDEESITIEPGARLNLALYERPLYAFSQAMFVNYFERFRTEIERIYGNNSNDWPAEWDFARVVRNSVSHDGCVNFRNLLASPVCWRGLTYSPSENGRKVLFDDLWFGDLIYLMMDLDAQF